MADPVERALILSPLAARNADQPIIRTLDTLDDLMRLPKSRQQVWVHLSAVAVVAHTFNIRRLWIEVLGHVLDRQLAEGARFEAEEVKDLINSREIRRAYLFEDEIGKRRAAMWCRYCGK